MLSNFDNISDTLIKRRWIWNILFSYHLVSETSTIATEINTELMHICLFEETI